MSEVMTAREMVRQTIDLLFEPGQVFEVRGIDKSGYVSYGYFSDSAKATEMVSRLDETGFQQGIYATINEVDPSLYARRADRIEKAGKNAASTGDANIRRRRWLLVDVDPKRASGISSSDSEKIESEIVIQRAKDFLSEFGFSEPIVGDSGNGMHLLYRIDLPNDPESKTIVENVLKTLHRFCSTDKCDVDTSVWNASRISKIYGTLTRKGDDTIDRPHRRSRIISSPDAVQITPVECLIVVAAMNSPPGETPKTSRKKTIGDSFDVPAFLSKAGLSYQISTTGPETVYKLDICPFCNGSHTDGSYISQNNETGALKAACHHNSCGAGKNRWKEFRAMYDPGYTPDKYDQKPGGKKKSAPRGDDEDPEQIRHLPHFEKDGRLYLTCISADDRYSYAHLKDGQVVFSTSEYDPMGVLTVPPELPVHQDKGNTVYIIGLPRSDLLAKAAILSPHDLYTKIRDHFFKYFDCPEVDYELFTYYSLYSWYFSKCSTAPYLRFLGDTGKGKSRFLKVISDLCFYPIRASGSSSISGLMRTKERWQGTLLVDEGDLKGDQSDPLIKYLNLGFEKDNYFLLTDKNDVSKCHIFDPYGPKLIAMRQPFRDNATEGRCLSFSPNETHREDIPPELPSGYVKEVAEIRALICRFTLEHWSEVSEDCMISCDGMHLEGRLKQMARPMSIILKLFPDGEERFRAYLTFRQQEIKQTRAESWEGNLFNYCLQLANGEESLASVPEFSKYYDNGRMTAVLPKMIAAGLDIKPKAVTTALLSVGMEVRQRRVTTRRGDKTTSEKVRPLTVPNQIKWAEILQRYYLPDDGGKDPDCPECLKGTEYNTRQTNVSKYCVDGCVPVQSGTTGTTGTEITTTTQDPESFVPHVPLVPLYNGTQSEENYSSDVTPGDAQ